MNGVPSSWARGRSLLLALPLLLALVVFTVWTASEGGYPASVWYPGAVFLLGLLVVTIAALPLRFAELPRSTRTAIVAFAAFTTWSYLSITWADDPGEAWNGANRTLLYAVVFALFALWPRRSGTAAAVLGAWTLAVMAVGFVTLAGLARSATPLDLFVDGRLGEPAGYPNAAAAAWSMALWPAVVLAGRREVAWWLRGVFGGSAVLLAELAVLGQSRGAVIAAGICLVLVFTLFPGRVRTFAVALPIGAAIALATPDVLDVRSSVGSRHGVAAAIDAATSATMLFALLAAIVVTLGALLDSRSEPSPSTARAVHRAIGAAGLLGAAGLVAAAVIAFGSPIDRLADGWDSFRQGYATSDPEQSRFASGLGSNRYDFYRVSLMLFEDHPVLGVGADNFAQDYLVMGRSAETPRYPHSLELRTLAQTGIVGAALLALALGAAALAVARATRRAPPFGGVVAGAAAMAFAYWAVHGSADWFWEFAGLGAPAFAMLGLACAIAPPMPVGKVDRGRWRARLTAVALVVAVPALAASLIAPWLAERHVKRAVRVWRHNPAEAFGRLEKAAALNPLSARPASISGSIALRLGDSDRAERDFGRVLARVPRDAYAMLELGAIASSRGRRARARKLLAEALERNPRDPVTRGAYERAVAGERIDVAALNRAIFEQASRIGR